jgi:hypothetical protein
MPRSAHLSLLLAATCTKQDFATGLKPCSIQVSATAPIAIVAHVGAGPTGGADTISVVIQTAEVRQ